MTWLDRFRRARPPEPDESALTAPVRAEGSVPGAAWMFAAADAAGARSVLDLGPATEASFDLYSRYVRRIRFADLLAGGTQDTWLATLDALPPQPDQPYDLVFAWNVLDWLSRDDGARVATRLAELTATDVRMHLILEASPAAMIAPLSFSWITPQGVRYEIRPEEDAFPRQPLLPAEVGHLLRPFRVERATTLKGGLREYVVSRNPRFPKPVT